MDGSDTPNEISELEEAAEDTMEELEEARLQMGVRQRCYSDGDDSGGIEVAWPR